MTEPSLSQHEFELLRKLIHRQIGVHLSGAKRVLLESRLKRRIQALGIDSFLGYYRSVSSAGNAREELQELVNAITTNTTSFFRERIQFDYLAGEAIPAWSRRANRVGAGRLRLWSAACSTGQEPYSIGAVLCAAFPQREHVDVKILGTDVSMRALNEARRARFPIRCLAEIPPAWRGSFVRHGHGADAFITVTEELRSMVVIEPLNLMATSYPFRGRFDAIFCRNVMIYFDEPTRRALLERLSRVLSPGGLLFLGLSESPIQLPSGMRSLGHSIYEHTV